MTRSPWLRVCDMQLDALFTLAFAPAPFLQKLNLAAYRNSQVYSTKDTPLPSRAVTSCQFMVSGSISLPLPGVLFAFPSRYLSAIGSYLVFSLGSWSTRILTGFLVPRHTQDTASRPTHFAYVAFTLSDVPSQKLPLYVDFLPNSTIAVLQPHLCGLGSSPFARRYLGNLF